MSDRHEKWVRVGPGHTVPAGQPYRIEYEDGSASEHPNVGGVLVRRATDFDLFVDSSWRPPLNQPTEPTWGIVVYPRNGGAQHSADIGCWRADDPDGLFRTNRILDGRFDTFSSDFIFDFIPLTDEQVARIEAAR
jgi:hypothetical protein